MEIIGVPENGLGFSADETYEIRFSYLELLQKEIFKNTDSAGRKAMSIESYFNSVKGHGVLSTADADGNVDSALYARPHVMEDGTIAFIMCDRLTHHNLMSNPKAAYLFIEDAN